MFRITRCRWRMSRLGFLHHASTGQTALGTPEVTSSGLFHQTKAPAREKPARASSHKENGNGGIYQNAAMVERHSSAAKDGVIEMLTAKASKLGASLERALVAKKELENRAGKLQVRTEQKGDVS